MTTSTPVPPPVDSELEGLLRRMRRAAGEPRRLRPAGTGKTFLLEALGEAAAAAGKHVGRFTREHLGVLIRRHRATTAVKGDRRHPAIRARCS